MALERYIADRGIPVTSTFADEEAWPPPAGQHDQPFGVIILLIAGGTFKTFHLINDVLRGSEGTIPW